MQAIPSIARGLITTATVLAAWAAPAAAQSKFGPADGVQDLGYTCTGCTSTVFQGSVVQMRLGGIFPNTAMFSAPDSDTSVTLPSGACRPTDYLALARIANALATSGNISRPFLLDLSAVIFGTTPARDCVTHTTSDTWSVRPDWQGRLNTFRMVSGTNFNTSNVWGIVIFTEIANQNVAVASNSQINQIAAFVKTLWPGIPVVGGYPTAATQPNFGMNFTPSIMPFQLDYIATWDYTVTNPIATIYAGDPVDPMAPSAFRNLKSRLRANQKLIYVPPTFLFTTAPTTCPARFTPGNGERFDLLVRNWCAWTYELQRPFTAGMVSFLWGPASQFDAQGIINWEVAHCGGSALKAAMVAAANAAATGSSCWVP